MFLYCDKILDFITAAYTAGIILDALSDMTFF